MITSMAFAMSTPIISAAHVPTVSIDNSRVKDNTPMILAITVSNAGPASIDNVWIIMPSEFTEYYPLIKIFKDNLVRLDNGWATDNVVTLPAGTLITLTGTLTDAIVPENTIVTRKSGENVYNSTTGKWYILSENASLKLVGSTTTDNLTADNATLPAALPSIQLDNGHVRLVSDTQVISLGGGVVKLPANTLVYLTTASTENISENTVTLVAAKTVTLDNADNARTTTTASVSAKRENVEVATIAAGVLLTLPAPNENVVVLPAGTQVRLPGAAAGIVRENTQVIRGVYENMLTVSGAENTSTENKPKGWTQTKIDNTVEWKGITDNIPSGGSRDFPFAVKTPTAAGTYTIYVRTMEIGGITYVQKSVTITVDNAKPTVTVAASPTWVKDNTAVTITVTANEPLAKLDTVSVKEINAPASTPATFVSVSADKTVWTWEYTTGDNVLRDGSATITVKGYYDLAGHKGDDASGTFTVDRRAPPKPNIVADITGWPKTPTNIGSYLVGGTAKDNYLGSAVLLTGGTVKVRVGTTVYENTIDGTGHWSQAIALTEGKQEVGVRYVDKAGNLGAENVENITYDKTKPSITPGTIAGKPLADGVRINVKKPTVTLTISDAVMGVENTAYGDNKGYSVAIWKENKDNVENLTNTLAHNRNTLQFQGAPKVDLADGTYYVYVVAGDNLQMDNKLVKFVVDTAKPPMPALLTPINNPVLYGTTAADPKMVKVQTLTLYGSGLEASSTARIYLVDHATGATISTENTPANAAGEFSKPISLVGGKVIRVVVGTIDEAGNVSDNVVYGYVMADWSAPTVTPGAPPATTTAASVTVTGSVSRDSWESYSDITLTLQVGISSVSVPVSADGSFSYGVPLSVGVNTIILQAADPLGNLSEPKTLTVERVEPITTTTPPPPVDTSAPTVTLDTLPVSTTEASIIITGTVAKDPEESYSEITVYVQSLLTSRSIPAGAGGNFSVPVALVEGPNAITVYAVDASGNVSDTKTATVERVIPEVPVDTTAPTVTITAPAAGTETGEASIVVTGRATEPGTWTIAASSGTYTGNTDTAGNFTAPVALVEGKNTIAVTAKDAAGNVSAYVSIEVTRTVTPWATYTIVIVIIVLILAAIAIFRKK